MSKRRLIDKQHRWLSLVEISGVVLSEPVLVESAPTGFRTLEKPELAAFYKAKDTWSLPPGMLSDPQGFWCEFILGKILELIPKYWLIGAAIPKELTLDLPAYAETLRPTRVLMDGSEPVMLFLQLPQGQGLDAPWTSNGGWKASATTKIDRLLRSTGVEIALITNGEAWRLIVASPSETMAHLTWTASTWADSPSTLAAFKELLGASRFFAGPRSGTILSLIRQSRVRQVEVADKLGDQVLEALNSFVHELDRVDAEFDGKPLEGYSDQHIYEAAAVFLMRVLFLFYAEENQLFPHGDVAYDRAYGVIHLLTQLENAYRIDPDSLLVSFDAYPRLLALFRLTHQGSSDPDIHINPYGGQLFDPDRFLLLEGRNSKGQICDFTPLPITNLVVRHILRSLKYVQEASYKQWVSYRSLAVEQIGYMYEGLLDFKLARNTEPDSIFLLASKDPLSVPFITASQVNALTQQQLIDKLETLTGKTAATITKLLEPPKAHQKNPRFSPTQPHTDAAIEQVRQKLSRLLRTNPIVRTGGLYLVPGEDRKASGTHYTPPILTEPIVRKTLEPLCINADGTPKSAEQLLDLKICDMTMGSGAFLVQAIRYLSARLLDAWDLEIATLPGVALTMPFGHASTAAVEEHLMPGSGPNAASDVDTRREMEVAAKRYVAQHCIYGVDKNHLAVEMAKLSLWLETLARDQPFTFLDHALKCGDSLLGVDHRVAETSMKEAIQGSIFDFDTTEIEQEVISIRADIADSPVRTAKDAKSKEIKLQKAEYGISLLKFAANISTAADFYFATGKEREAFKAKWKDRYLQAAGEWVKNRKSKMAVNAALLADLEKECSEAVQNLNPFHWPLEFPEVYIDKRNPGMDAFIGNPPFLSGKRISTRLGDANLAHLKNRFDNSGGTTDLCAYFFRGAYDLLANQGLIGMVATNTIAQGDTRTCALETIISRGGTIFHAIPTLPWPGKASLEVAIVGICKGAWSGSKYLNDLQVENISSFLAAETEFAPKRLKESKGVCFAGSYVNGMGFTLTKDDADQLIAKRPENKKILYPYIIGDDLNSRPDQTASRWIINFEDWPLDRVSQSDWSTADKKQKEEWKKLGLVDPAYNKPVAADFPECLAIVREKVKPSRDELKRDNYRLKWWQFAERCPGLYKSIAGLSRVFAACKHSKFVILTAVPATMVFNEGTNVFATSSFAEFALYQSSIHEIWARKYGSTLETRFRYAHTDCVETFPRPNKPLLQNCESIGEDFHQHRHACMRARGIGLTDLYNLFHSRDCSEPDIRELRELMQSLDRAILTTYQWQDIQLEYDFVGEEDPRYSFDEHTKKLIMTRLNALNQSLS